MGLIAGATILTIMGLGIFVIWKIVKEAPEEALIKK